MEKELEIGQLSYTMEEIEDKLHRNTWNLDLIYDKPSIAALEGSISSLNFMLETRLDNSNV